MPAARFEDDGDGGRPSPPGPTAGSPRGPGWWLPAIVGVAIACRLILAVPSLPDGLFDDAYISFRYAARIAAGEGFTFNDGERVLGTTSPLLTLVLAGLAGVLGPGVIPGASVALGLAGAVVLLVALRRALFEAEIDPRTVAVVSLVAATYPLLAKMSVSGMETGLLLGGMFLLQRSVDRLSWTGFGVCGGALVLLRFDAGLFVAMQLVAIWASEQRTLRVARAVRAALLAGLPVLTWTIFAFAEFGSVLPQSAVGKLASHGAFGAPEPAHIASGLSYLIPLSFLGVLRWPAWIVALLIAGWGAGRLSASSRSWRAASWFCVVYAAILIATKAPLFSWYYAPLVAYFWIFVVIGSVGIAQHLARRSRFSGNVVAGLVSAVAFIAVSAYAVSEAVKAWREPESVRETARLAREASDWVRPNETVLLEHIGLFGFRNDVRIIDPMGLVTPRAVELRRSSLDCWLAALVEEADPDVLVLYPDWRATLESSCAEGARLLRSYETIRSYATEPPSEVLRRRDRSAAR